MQTSIDQLINHISLVLDASTSMQMHKDKVVQVAKNEIKNLAEKSQDFNQDTRISIYQFSGRGTTKCLVYDKDVLRLPDITNYYKIGGNTALIDATIQSIDELQEVPERYGDHAFFQIVVTDGEENESSKTSYNLISRLQQLKDNWTIAALVPNQVGVSSAERFGFTRSNIAVWDTSSRAGFETAGQSIRTATTSFYENRSKGIRSSKDVFNLNTSLLSRDVVTKNLGLLEKSKYNEWYVTAKQRADEFCRLMTGHFVLGTVYYQLSKPEEIQPQKSIIIRDKSNANVYSGSHARGMIGLPNTTVKVAPADHPLYDIFVQSTAPNRNLMPGTKVLVMR